MINIQPVEADGQFWVRLDLDGSEMRRGPFANADEAGAMAARVAGICRAMHYADVYMQTAPRDGGSAAREATGRSANERND
jgi:hypothetical protein